jgi:PEGA domain-containing protein
MTRGKLLVAVSVAAWALGTTPAWAQRERGDAPSTGSAVDRGSSGSSSSSPSSGGASTSSGAGSSGSSSTSGSSGGGYTAEAVSAPSNAGVGRYVSAPVRPSRSDEDAAQGRTSSGGGGRRPSADAGDRGGSRAVNRGSDASGAPSGARTANASNGDSDPSRRAVPTYARPRDGRPITGTAVDRPAGYYGGGGGNNSIYYPYYPSYPYYRYYYPGYAFGLGFYDFGWYDPYYYGGYYPGGYSGGGYGGGYGGGGYPGGDSSGTSSYGRGPSGSLRLKIKPRDGQVYIDGYLVGVVDDFDGMFQKLGIDAGGHRVEIRAPGHETISFDVLITPGETVTYKGELPVK